MGIREVVGKAIVECNVSVTDVCASALRGFVAVALIEFVKAARNGNGVGGNGV